MVLHMVCALGDRYRRLEESLAGQDAHGETSEALEHYTAALRLLVASTQDTAAAPANLEYILGALWLMIVYEQKHGDGCGAGLFAHLRGGASLLRDLLQSLRFVLQEELFDVAPRERARLPVGSIASDSPELSSLTARIII
jgi:hypothetical protein